MLFWRRSEDASGEVEDLSVGDLSAWVGSLTGGLIFLSLLVWLLYHRLYPRAIKVRHPRQFTSHSSRAMRTFASSRELSGCLRYHRLHPPPAYRRRGAAPTT